MELLDDALTLATSGSDQVMTVTGDDVALARSLSEAHSHLSARDLLHLAVCRRHGIKKMMTFDRALGSVFND
jgi:predicted nucleic acid-binding protein